jgi:hypothetical protein
MIKLTDILKESQQKHRVSHARFLENVLGIKLSIEESNTLLEGGKLPQELEERIQSEIALYENFLTNIVAKIGGIPKDLSKTFTDAASFLKFIYNVVSDKTGENLEKAIALMQRNAKALFARIERVINAIPAKIKEIFNKALTYIKKVAASILGIKSDVDASDELTGDSGNWKKFIMLLLVGMLLIFLIQVPDLVKGFGEDKIAGLLETAFGQISTFLSKIFTNPLELAKVIAGPALVAALGTIVTVFKSIKLLAFIQTNYLASNAWLTK